MDIKSKMSAFRKIIFAIFCVILSISLCACESGDEKSGYPAPTEKFFVNDLPMLLLTKILKQYTAKV